LELNSLGVFCGSSHGKRNEYSEAARGLGAILAERKITLVYGAGNVGLMDTIANAVLEGGGEVIGVIPKALADLNVVHLGLTDLRVVGSMHERKALMAELSQGFVALPGGIGTLEELFEMLTWAQLGIQQKPCGLLDVLDYYGPLNQLLDHAVEEGFLIKDHRDALLTAKAPEALLDKMTSFAITPPIAKYLDRKTS
jgi:uncharacterized protein (TIGR00730 family)